MKSIAAATLFASIAFAQTTTLVPKGISDTCSKFLTDFNSDSSFAGCTSSIITATSAFSPSTNSSAAASNPSASAVQSALSSVCSTTACSESTIRTTLTNFYQACTVELSTSPNKDVIMLYDVVYNLSPYRTAICTKDADGSSCPSSVGKVASQSSGVLSTISKYASIPVGIASSALSRRADAQAVAAVQLNATTFTSNNVLFLGLSPDLSKDELCNTCTRSILTSYIAFQATSPYAPGLVNSVLLAGQSKLYQGVLSTCGSDFFTQGSGVAAAAGPFRRCPWR